MKSKEFVTNIIVCLIFFDLQIRCKDDSAAQVDRPSVVYCQVESVILGKSLD